jgi:hypothetical protein
MLIITSSSLCLVVLSILNLLIVVPRASSALEASWIPATSSGSTAEDATTSMDGPLPLSKNYRDKLRKLCKLMDSPTRSPSSPNRMEENRNRELRMMCQRLKQDDESSSLIPSSSTPITLNSSSIISKTNAVVVVALTGFIGIITSTFYYGCWSYWMDVFQTVVQSFLQ